MDVDTLTYTAGPGETNVVSVEEHGGGIAVHDTVPITHGERCEDTSDPDTVVCDPAYVVVENFDLGDGDDRLAGPLHDAVTNVEGGPGNDVIDAAEAGGGLLQGGSGDDDIRASAVGSTMIGGPGADRFVGGVGNADFVSYSDHAESVSVTQDGVANDGAAGEGDNVVSGVEEVEGGDGPDYLIGTDATDYIVGNNGDDQIDGGGGADILEGGGGADWIDGGAGSDTIRGYTSDLIGHFPEPGPATPPSDDGPGILRGGTGDDEVRGGPAADDIDAGAGEDVVEGGGGGDVVHARDAAFDLVTCANTSSADGRARLDELDLARRCATLERAGIAAPKYLLVGQSDIDPVGVIHVVIGCSQDEPGGCGGTLRLRRMNGRLLAKRRMSIPPGGVGVATPRVRLPGVFSGRACKRVPVTIRYATHDAARRRVTLTTHLKVWSSYIYCNPPLFDPFHYGWATPGP